MRYLVFIGFILGLAWSLSGCASLSKQQCVEGNWLEIGRQDGIAGMGMERFQEHIKACDSYGIHPNLALYKQGRDLGLKSYCDVQRQLNLGLSGERYRPVCSGPIARLLKRANEWGYQGYRVKSGIHSSQQQLDEVREKLRDKNIKKEEAERLEGEEQRLLDEIDRLRLELVRIKSGAEQDLTYRTNQFYKTRQKTH